MTIFGAHGTGKGLGASFLKSCPLGAILFIPHGYGIEARHQGFRLPLSRTFPHSEYGLG